MNRFRAVTNGVAGSWVVRLGALSVLILMIASGAFAQTPTTVTFKTITGNPLKINIGSDTAFQVFNTAVPGSGQVYPSSCQNIADMGMFVNADGQLIAPDFTNHGCGTATGGLGSHLSWSGTVSDVSGDGGATSPFVVSVTAAAGGVSITMRVSYVNGENFFRLSTSYASSTAHIVNAYLAADIYLASSDAGVYFLEPSLHAPGGHDCSTPSTYTILLIPITPASRVAATAYGTVWTEIGRNQLDNTVTPAGCIDNGAGLEWDNIGPTAQIESAVSFGDIPPVSAFQGSQPFTVTIDPNEIDAGAGDSVEFTVTTAHVDPDWKSPITLSLGNFPDTMTARLDQTTFDAPGDGTTKLHVTFSPDIFPSTYRGLTVFATSGDPAQTFAATASINLLCDPPFILGTSQPKSQTVARGTKAKVSVTVDGGLPVRYQWYRGHSGSTFQPLDGENSPSLTTATVNEVQEYWVRVTNACGTEDSQTAVVTPTP